MKPQKRVAILQSNYIPWKGYFDMIRSVDEFILFDEVQFTKRDWRNRNQIKTAQGPIWLSIPVVTKNRYEQKISETEILDGHWALQHWENIRHAYRKACAFDEFAPLLGELYQRAGDLKMLSDVNQLFLRAICQHLSIATPITNSCDYGVIEGKTERLLDLCIKSEAQIYVSGPAAKSYLDETLFHQQGIEVVWFDYAGYPEYPQLHPPFVHAVSVVDLIFNMGAQALQSLRKTQA